MATFAGIDLAAYEKNPTGVAAYDGRSFFSSTLKDDASISSFIFNLRPSVVAIDAPLTLPRGPKKIRECDRALIRMGYRVFPPLFSQMKSLTLRGIYLREKLEKEGYRVIEVHPRTTLKILGISRFPGTEHESDACAAALMASLYHEGKYRAVGDDEGIIIIPLGLSE